MKHTHKCVFGEVFLLANNKKYTNSNLVNVSEPILFMYVKMEEEPWYFVSTTGFILKCQNGGSLVAQLVKHPTLDFGSGCEIEPQAGLWCWAWSVLGILSLYSSPTMHTLSPTPLKIYK